MGKAVAGHRDDFVIATKFGFVDGSRTDSVDERTGTARALDGRPEYVRRACDASLQRLGAFHHNDLYYLHRAERTSCSGEPLWSADGLEFDEGLMQGKAIGSRKNLLVRRDRFLCPARRSSAGVYAR